MKLYHGSNLAVVEPRIINRFKTLDFGEGFYTTSNKSQAEEFAVKVQKRRGNEGTSTVNVYEFDVIQAEKFVKFLKFDVPNEKWLDFVVHNRKFGRNDDSDIIIGPVANDDIFETIALYETGQIDKEYAIQKFKVKNLFNQYLFCNAKALAYIKFESSYAVKNEDKNVGR